MKKLLKFSLYGLLGLIALLAILVGVIAATFNPNDYKPLIVKLVQEKKQRTLHIDGDIKLTFWPKIGADLGKISISEHKNEKQFAGVNGLKVSLAVMPLLQKQVVVDTIYVDGATANIVRYKDGSTNFDDLLSKEEEDESQPIKFDVDGVNVSNSSVSLTDEQAGASYSISQFNLKTGHVALKTPFDLATDFVAKASNPKVNANIKVKGNFMADPEAKHFVAKGLDANINGDLATISKADIRLTGDVDAKPENMELLVDGLKLVVSGNLEGAKLNAEIAAPKLVVQKDVVSGKEAQINISQEKGSDSLKAKLMLADIKGSPSKLESSGITGDVSMKQGSRSVESKFASPFSGNLEKLIFDLPKLAGSVDVKDPAIPNGGMKADFNFNVHADVKAQNINTDFNIAVDESKLKGTVAVAGFSQPAINLNLDIDKLDADKYITKSPAKPASESKPADPNAPIDLSGLKVINAKGDLHVGWLKVANIKTTDVRVKFDANKGLIEMPTLAAKLYDGSMNGSLKLDARSTPNIAFKQNMAGIAIGPLLTDAINNDMLSGKGTLNVDITTQGNTVGALKKALNGTAGVNLADGAVKGIDIAGTLRGVKDKLNVLKSESKVEGDKSKKTDFSEMVATFQIKNGVAHNEDLSMKAPLFRITGNGDIDIANETLNYLAKPTVVATLKGQGGGDLDGLNGLTVPVKLTGTFAKPSYAIDFASMGAALAQKKVMDSVSNIKGGDALKSLLGGKKTENTSGTTAPAQKPATPEDKAKQKLNKLLGL